MSSLHRVLIATPLLLLQGCLSTWIRMEDGTVLQPGKSDFSLAIGTVPRPEYECKGFASPNPTSGGVVCREYRYDYRYTDTGYVDFSTYSNTPAIRTENREPHFAMSWRLGLLGPFGPFTGLEAGMQTEAATNPITQEFKLALGLPGSDSIVAHSVIAGWGVGVWADNSWFLQYAASRRFGSLRLFGSARATLQSTQVQNLFDTTIFVHKRTWDYQVAAGARVELGDIAVIPDWMLVGATVDLGYEGYPSFNVSESNQESGMGVALALGMGWSW